MNILFKIYFPMLIVQVLMLSVISLYEYLVTFQI